MPEKDRMREALEEAIRFETDGREFFLKAAQKAKSYFAKLIFETIAEEELGHIKRVRDIFDRSATSEKQAFPPWVQKKVISRMSFNRQRKILTKSSYQTQMSWRPSDWPFNSKSKDMNSINIWLKWPQANLRRPFIVNSPKRSHTIFRFYIRWRRR